MQTRNIVRLLTLTFIMLAGLTFGTQLRQSNLNAASTHSTSGWSSSQILLAGDDGQESHGGGKGGGKSHG